MKNTINIGFLGMGVVGGGAYQTLNDNRESIENRIGAPFHIKRIAVAHPDRPRPYPVDRRTLTGDPYEVLNDPDIHIVVELIGGVEPVHTYIRHALLRGKHIVTANKELLAKHGMEILEEAGKRGLDVCFEGAVAGGIPIIRPLMTSLAGNRIDRIEGIVNGTTNYILTRMAAEKKDFAEVLADAQRLGYAEADPSSDVDGWDAAYKMCILAGIGMNACVPIDQVHTEGISRITERDFDYARELGYAIKLLGLARRNNGRLEVRVNPALLPDHHPLAHVDDVFNAVMVTGSSVGSVMFYGRGAGALPTGSAVVGDIVEVARGLVCGSPAPSRGLRFDDAILIPASEALSCYYLRLQVADRPRALSSIAGALGEQEVSISRVTQHELAAGVAELVLLTHPCPDANLRAALARIEDADTENAILNVIRVEE